MRLGTAVIAGAAFIAVLLLVYTYPTAGDRYVYVEPTGGIKKQGLPYIDGDGQWYMLYTFWAYHVILAAESIPATIGGGTPICPRQIVYFHLISPNYLSYFLEGNCDGFTVIDQLYEMPSVDTWNYCMWTGKPQDCGCVCYPCEELHRNVKHVNIVFDDVYPWRLGDIKVMPAVDGRVAQLLALADDGNLTGKPVANCRFMVSEYYGAKNMTVRLYGGVWYVETPVGTYTVPYVKHDDIYLHVGIDPIFNAVDAPSSRTTSWGASTPWGAYIRVYSTGPVPCGEGWFYEVKRGSSDTLLGWGLNPPVTHVLRPFYAPLRTYWNYYYVAYHIFPNGTIRFIYIQLYPYMVYIPKGCRLYLPYPAAGVSLGLRLPWN